MDSTNAIKFNHEERVTKRNLHIGVRYCRVRYHAAVGDLHVGYINTNSMTADLGTKVTNEETFVHLQGKMTQIVDINNYRHLNDKKRRKKARYG